MCERQVYFEAHTWVILWIKMLDVYDIVQSILVKGDYASRNCYIMRIFFFFLINLYEIHDLVFPLVLNFTGHFCPLTPIYVFADILRGRLKRRKERWTKVTKVWTMMNLMTILVSENKCEFKHWINLLILCFARRAHTDIHTNMHTRKSSRMDLYLEWPNFNYPSCRLPDHSVVLFSVYLAQCVIKTLEALLLWRSLYFVHLCTNAGDVNSYDDIVYTDDGLAINTLYIPVETPMTATDTVTYGASQHLRFSPKIPYELSITKCQELPVLRVK